MTSVLHMDTLTTQTTHSAAKRFTVLHIGKKYDADTARAFLHRVGLELGCNSSVDPDFPRTFILHRDATREEIETILPRVSFEFHRLEGRDNPGLPFAVRFAA